MGVLDCRGAESGASLQDSNTPLLRLILSFHQSQHRVAATQIFETIEAHYSCHGDAAAVAVEGAFGGDFEKSLPAKPLALVVDQKARFTFGAFEFDDNFLALILWQRALVVSALAKESKSASRARKFAEAGAALLALDQEFAAAKRVLETINPAV